MEEKHIKLSRFLSLILRHKPEIIGLTLDNQGYLNVDELIKKTNNSGRYIDEKILDEIVETDNKGRYSYNDNKSMIRANQGHSISVNLGLLECKPPDILYHGTAKKFANKIIEEGLDKQNRLHVHLSENIDTAISVGSRRGKSIVFIVNAKEMYEDGCEFYVSENNVWLVDKVDKRYLNVKGENNL